MEPDGGVADATVDTGINPWGHYTVHRWWLNGSCWLWNDQVETDEFDVWADTDGTALFQSTDDSIMMQGDLNCDRTHGLCYLVGTMKKYIPTTIPPITEERQFFYVVDRAGSVGGRGTVTFDYPVQHYSCWQYYSVFADSRVER